MDVAFEPTFAAWRTLARDLVAAGEPPAAVNWVEQRAAEQGLFGVVERNAGDAPRPLVPAEFMELASIVAQHRDLGRWSLLYRLLWRLLHEDKDLLADAVDDDVRRARLMAAQVRRDIHKMHAFVRFKRLAGEERYVAWHVPDHFIVEAATPFFARRFAAMRWTIFTPDASATWDGEALSFGPGCQEGAAPRFQDDLEELWKCYYSSIFNPARIKIRMMKREMPVRHWRTLPEAAIIDELLAEAPRRVERMLAAQPPSARSLVPEDGDLARVAEAGRACRACALCERATQVVFGEGPSDATIMIVGEQPGDQEDRVGRPFVGPAGALLDRALAAAGIERAQIYVTNAVKHFKWEQNGKVRLHKRPQSAEIAACRPWLDAELARVAPRVLVCLGATAAQAILGRAVRLGAERGRFLPSSWTPFTMIALHPAAILRQEGEAQRAEAFEQLVRDLQAAQRAAAAAAAEPKSDR